MKRSFPIFLLLPSLLFGLAAPAPAEDAPEASADVEAKAGEIIDRMELRTARTVWDLVPALEDLGEAALGRIEEGVQSENPVVRLACAKALYHMGFGEPEPLGAMIEAEVEPLASMAAEVLGMFGEDEEADLLAEVLKGSPPPPVRAAVAEALASLRPENSGPLDVLRGLMKSGDPALVEGAALTLVALGEEEPARDTVDALRSEPSFRGRLAQSLFRRMDLEAALRQATRPRGNPVKEVMDLVGKHFADTTSYWGGKPVTVDDVFLRDAAALGMARSLDPFCDYWTREQYDEDRNRAKGQYAGIGAFVVMREILEEGEEPPPPWGDVKTVVTVDRPIYAPPSPAYNAGLRSGDQIVAFFDADEKKWVSIVGWPLERCVGKLKGPEGTVVRIRVKRFGKKTPLEFTIKRQWITVNVALPQRLPGGIGYILLRRFDNKSSIDFERAMKALKKEGLRGLVVDLRGNPGGTMRQVVNIIDRFLPKNALITFTRGEVEDWTQFYKSRWKPHPEIPLALLIRKDSASGSEMMAGALKAHGRAVIVGESSYGKGSGQTLMGLESTKKSNRVQRFLRLTIFKYYLPDNTSIHDTGVKPDIPQEPDRIESWQYDWQIHMSRAGLLREYVNRHWDEHRERFLRLADFDDFSTEDYPGFEDLFRRAVRLLYDARKRWTRAPAFPAFEAFFARHDVKEDRDILRMLVRALIRKRVQDERKAPFIQDHQEDVQLQRAIYEVLKRLGETPADHKHYKHFANRFR
jgi:carboxyl-terminal processing protease